MIHSCTRTLPGVLGRSDRLPLPGPCATYIMGPILSLPLTRHLFFKESPSCEVGVCFLFLLLGWVPAREGKREATRYGKWNDGVLVCGWTVSMYRVIYSFLNLALNAVRYCVQRSIRNSVARLHFARRCGRVGGWVNG